MRYLKITRDDGILLDGHHVPVETVIPTTSKALLKRLLHFKEGIETDASGEPLKLEKTKSAPKAKDKEPAEK